jgi:hypothetical protein
MVSQLGYQVGFSFHTALFAALLIQWGQVGSIFLFSLITSSLVGSAGQRGESLVFLRFNLRGYSGVAKILADPPSSITDFWIRIASPVTSYIWVILFNLLQPITHSERASDYAHWWAVWSSNQAHTVPSLGLFDRKE